MDRVVIFIDAGHLLAEGGNLCCGTKKRAEIVCKYKELVEALIARVEERDSLKVLRVYWYDGAQEFIPTSDHLDIARLPRTKLRLGRLSGGKQKGVDALIVRDMMKLAGAGAMATAYLLAGDEDLRIGVVEAQELGVRVVLVGIPPVVSNKLNQADTLMRECDGHDLLDKPFLSGFFSKQTANPSAVAGPAPTPSAAPPPPSVTVQQAGENLGSAWAQRASHAELSALWARHPRIPVELDAQLLRDGETKLGSLRGQDASRQALRKSFWAAIEKAYKQFPPPAAKP